jgi:hypothetical protein
MPMHCFRAVVKIRIEVITKEANSLHATNRKTILNTIYVGRSCSFQTSAAIMRELSNLG